MDEQLQKFLSEMLKSQADVAAILAGAKAGGMQIGAKQPAGTPIVPPWYGQQGLFGCTEDDVLINASVNDVGIASWLNWYPSIDHQRTHGILSQMSKDTSDTKQTGPCTDCPSYEFKGCSMTWCFGRLCCETPELLADQMGVRPYKNHPIRRWYGAIPGGPQGSVIGRDDEWALVMAAHCLRGHNAQLMWPGNPSNNAALGGYMEFKGLDMLINTGYVDIMTGATCDAADSEVKAFNRQLVCDSGTTNPWTIYQYMVQMYRTIQYRAMTGLGAPIDPMDMVWVSAPEVIDCIIDCLACTYYPCLAGTGSTALQISAERAANFRDRMVREQVFHIDGVDIPWFKDPFSTVETGLAFGDETCADLFLLTRRHGPMELTFGEFQNMATAPDNKFFGQNLEHIFSTDGGRFLWAIDLLKWCGIASGLLKTRIITLAPWLCGRLTDVCCRTPQHYPSPDPGSVYAVDGGHGTPLGKSLYDICADEDLRD